MSLIDANRLKQNVLDWEDCYNGFSDTYDKARIIDEIDAQPTIEAEPTKYGKWTITECFGVKDMTCSYCGWLYEYHAGMEEEWNYCPYCGALMEAKDEDAN